MSTSSKDTSVQRRAGALPPAEVAVRITEFIEVVEEHIHEVGVVATADDRTEPEP